MRCYANQLAGQLKQGLQPFYLIFGEEPFQEAQCVSAVRQMAKRQGFDEVIKFSLLPGFDWLELVNQYNSMSLFSAQTLIEFDLNQQKPPTQGVNILKELAANPNPDVILILKGAKASQDIQRSAWFKALDKQGLFVPCYALTGYHLQRWLDDECKRLKLNLNNDAKRSLLQATEGNLLATHQELEKLSLLYKSAPIDQEKLLSGLLNQAKFDIFDLNDGLLRGNPKTLIKVLNKLAHDNVEPASIAWTLHNQAQLLLNLKQLIQSGTPTQDAFKKHNVWKNQQQNTQQALDRLNTTQLEQLLVLLAEFDSAYKRNILVAPYQALAHIALSFCQSLPFALPYEELA
ncbi:DNA polymerase III subunit delta [Pseudoalteromonas sp. DL2-H2.2]|uniref:DNA polymerase III subunit delta n=1 Tax=Pseudoalteromonas rubra TaxID=43658 RepID=A0A0F4QW68_9GAMM|nr:MULTISPECIES: DNA polymerase III subunit delta [Pseudoalteromonas]KJZ10872.1 DNA polymerase III subunit delta [Pseudoalteromonas rubra]MCF2910620.1 DNA polymerase III subunit delta [Pseudoalteromonas sp. DL2-H2.2]